MKKQTIIILILLLLYGGVNAFAKTKTVYRVEAVNVATKINTTLYVLASDPEEAAQEVTQNGWTVNKVESSGRYRTDFKDNSNGLYPQIKYLLTIYFEPCKYSALIDNETVKKIKGLDSMSHYIIYGHSDSKPVNKSNDFTDNYELSIKRAEFFKNFIISMTEIPADNIKIVGLGEYYPKVDNTIDGASENRRAELYERD